MPKLPHVFKRIRLELARSKVFPNGSATHGYEFVAPLDRHGLIDPVQWSEHRSQCGVRRFWDDEEENGHLVHRPGGAEHARWMFDYNAAAQYDDEAGYKFGSHRFGLGDYVSIADEKGLMNTFRVVSVEATT